MDTKGPSPSLTITPEDVRTAYDFWLREEGRQGAIRPYELGRLLLTASIAALGLLAPLDGLSFGALFSLAFLPLLASAGLALSLVLPRKHWCRGQ